jgi:hypothetical protein
MAQQKAVEPQIDRIGYNNEVERMLKRETAAYFRYIPALAYGNRGKPRTNSVKIGGHWDQI